MNIVLACARSDLRFALEVFLREQPGVVVVGTATGGRGLLALVESTCPDVVILDWRLPGLSLAGEPLAGVVAAAETCEQPPCTIVLGRDEFDRQAVLDAGADAFVWRGDPPETLLVALRQFRSRRDAPCDLLTTQEKGE